MNSSGVGRERARQAAAARAAIVNASEALFTCNVLTRSLVGDKHEDAVAAFELLTAVDDVTTRVLRYEVACRLSDMDGKPELRWL